MAKTRAPRAAPLPRSGGGGAAAAAAGGGRSAAQRDGGADVGDAEADVQVVRAADELDLQAERGGIRADLLPLLVLLLVELLLSRPELTGDSIQDLVEPLVEHSHARPVILRIVG